MSDIRSSPNVRVAVEGCGHGTLDAIYASVEISCRQKGWDGVDLVIIGGDFQAVRNQRDLNVTAMPQKYRQMADFHAYYSGAKTAPYLTIFIGGNHEASNHLFELYYGGWVAPNIYYLGAANVIRFGPLRIAALSGIWKGYDYRKPHYERLPYNKDDMNTFYHVRELDVRKLLAIRSQVDIGLSHDWPKEVEYSGDFKHLFIKKQGFKIDSEKGQLGSVAAKECLQRLRPVYWFSAHLHTKFSALVTHSASNQPDIQQHITSTATAGIRAKLNDEIIPGDGNHQGAGRYVKHPQQQKLSAWQNFHTSAREADLAARDQAMQERTDRKEVEERTGVRPTVGYTLQETFRKVVADDMLNRTITSTETTDRPPKNEPSMIPNLDGSHLCRPTKRQFETFANDIPTKDPNAIEIDLSDEDPVEKESPRQKDSAGTGPHDKQEASNKLPLDASSSANAATNPDEIDLEISDEDDKSKERSQQATNTSQSGIFVTRNGSKTLSFEKPFSGESEGGVTISQQNLNPRVRPFITQDARFAPAPAQSALPPTGTHRKVWKPLVAEPTSAVTSPIETSYGGGASMNDTIQQDENVSEEVRQKLAALSSNFTKNDTSSRSPALPFPPEVANLQTRFLALGKVEMYQEFLQLLEIEPISQSDPVDHSRPFKLHYDPEWFALLRVFAPELTLGGDPSDRTPPHRGETYYQTRIEEEAKWVQTHLVETNLLEVPENFSITAPVYDPNEKIDSNEMPREVTNPQTSRFCELIGIDNLFDIPESERDERIRVGPRPEKEDGRRVSGHHPHGRRDGGSNGGHKGGHGRAGRGRSGGGGGRRW